MVTLGGAGAAGSTGALSLWSGGALAGRGRRASAGVGGTGKSAQSPGKEWQSLKADQETVPFSPKPAATIQKHAGLVHTGTVPRCLGFG